MAKPARQTRHAEPGFSYRSGLVWRKYSAMEKGCETVFQRGVINGPPPGFFGIVLLFSALFLYGDIFLMLTSGLVRNSHLQLPCI